MMKLERPTHVGTMARLNRDPHCPARKRRGRATAAPPVSRPGARTRRYLGMPAAYVGELDRQLELRRLHEVDRHQAGDIRHREVIAGNEQAVPQFAIE